MKKTTLVLLVLFAVPAFAGSDKDGTCKASDILGVYGFKGEGQIVAEGTGFPVGPIITVGTLTFNKDGTYQTKQNLSTNGTILRNVVFSGTYTLNSDCTFTLFDTDGVTAIDFGVLVANGREFYLMPELEGIAVTIAGKRISKARR